jgi:hypothetical protein
VVCSVTYCAEFTKAFFIFKCHTVSRQTRECNLIYDLWKSMTFPESIFMKLANSTVLFANLVPDITLIVQWTWEVGIEIHIRP